MLLICPLARLTSCPQFPGTVLDFKRLPPHKKKCPQMYALFKNAVPGFAVTPSVTAESSSQWSSIICRYNAVSKPHSDLCFLDSDSRATGTMDAPKAMGVLLCWRPDHSSGFHFFHSMLLPSHWPYLPFYSHSFPPTGFNDGEAPPVSACRGWSRHDDGPGQWVQLAMVESVIQNICLWPPFMTQSTSFGLSKQSNFPLTYIDSQDEQWHWQ